ncbi:MAG: agmatine deiminase family protein [Firmicutes bacterium]|nr:agmatine deiminase family protein [Bacillota bacterium]
MKAEFENHKYTVLLYPQRQDVWRKDAVCIKKTVEELSQVVSKYEKVFLGHNEDNVPKIKSSEHLKVINIPNDDIWTRDTGPIPLKDDSLVSFEFDAWGGLCKDTDKDREVAQKIADLEGKETKKSFLVLEGGNIVSDGHGTLMAIKSCVMSRNSKPFDEIKKELKSVLQVQNIIWIERGLIHDETGGHIDNLCVFADISTILLAWTDDEKNPQYEVVREAFEVLSVAKNMSDKNYKIIKVPLPDIFMKNKEDVCGVEIVHGTKTRFEGESVQPSYINFMFVNGGIILPQFGVQQDEEAYEIFKKIFPKREIIRFEAREVVLGGGGLHCISRNI